MGKILSDAEIRAYADEGYHFPVRVMSPAQATAIRSKVEAFEADQLTAGVKGTRMQKLYLLLTWMNDIVRNPTLLDAVEDVLGPDILCWQSSFFIKDPSSPNKKLRKSLLLISVERR